jgi:DNA-binding MarR family transcriptional regulator
MNVDIEQRAFEALRRISRATDRHSRFLLREYELTGPQLAVLKALAHRRQAPIGVLAKAAFMGAPTVTGIVDRLERQGLVTRVRSATDRRQVFVVLTETGHRLVERDPPLLSAGFRSRFLRLPEDEKRQICSVLQHVADMTEGPAPSAAIGDGDDQPLVGELAAPADGQTGA